MSNITPNLVSKNWKESNCFNIETMRTECYENLFKGVNGHFNINEHRSFLNELDVEIGWIKSFFYRIDYIRNNLVNHHSQLKYHLKNFEENEEKKRSNYLINKLIILIFNLILTFS